MLLIRNLIFYEHVFRWQTKPAFLEYTADFFFCYNQVTEFNETQGIFDCMFM